MATEVERMLELVQKGKYIPENEDENINQVPSDHGRNNSPFIPGPGFNELRLAPGGEQRNEALGLQAAQAGYGQSRYDRGEFVPGDDLENKRAIEQPGFWKVANGAIKGGVIAGTTAVQTVAGVIDGLLEGSYELARQIAEGEKIRPGNAIGVGVNNFTARTMTDIQRLSEEWFPNYRTSEERTEQYQRDWLRHIFTGNFIGDMLLKNFGFTVGAIGGGMVWSRALNAALRAGLAGDLMKGVTAAAEGNAEARATLENTLKLINGSSAHAIDDIAVAKNISNAARSLNKMNAKQMLFGGVIGAMGEGTMEGVMARNEFMEDYTDKLNQEYLASREQLREKLINELDGTRFVRRVPVVGEDGNVTFVSELNELGEARLAQEQRKLADDYSKRREYSEDEGDRLAATTFLLNLPILTASNTLQFGRLFSGGFKTARKTAKVAGGITKKAGEIAADYSSGVSKAAVMAERFLGNRLAEASEELSQGYVSSGAKNVADSRLTSFNDDAYDKDVARSFASWFNDMTKGGNAYLSDWKNWQEGFLGFITGGISHGSVIGDIKSINEAVEDSGSASAILNERVNSKKFQDAWKGYVRHMKYENEMEEAVVNDDQYTWKTANDKQLVNDIMMFADAGRLDDLKDLVDTYANMSVDDAENNGTLEAVTSRSNESEVANNPAEALGKIQKQAKDIKDNIDLYNDMYESMSAIAPMGVSDDQLKELISTAMNVKAFEKRFLTMFDELIGGLDKYVKPLSSETKLGKKITDEAEKVERAKEIYSMLADVYTGTGVPVDTPLVEALGTMATLESLHDTIEESGDQELIKRYDDMVKVAADRKRFLKKMLTLQDLDPVKYEEKKETPEKVVNEQRQERAKEQTQGLKSVDDIKKAYLGRNAKDKVDFINDISTIEDSDSNVRDFLKLKRRHDAFRGFLEKNGYDNTDITVTPPMVNSVINDLFRRSRSEDELINLPDNVFPTLDEFSRDFTSIFGAPGPGTLASVKQIIRNAMNSFIEAETATASRDTISPEAVIPDVKPETVSNPTGYDAAQPGSLEPAPVKADDKEVKAEDNPALKKEEPEPVESVKPTADELVHDAANAVVVDDIPKGAEDETLKVKGRGAMILYYRTSVPEVSSSEAKKGRDAVGNNDREKLKEVDLSDFVNSHPEFSEIWNALKDRNAFDNVATKLKVGDTIELVIDPTFPTYEGAPQVLLTTIKDGKRLVLNVLSGQTSKYYGLDELRRRINNEYDSFKEEHPNDLFVFDKKAVVWAKRSGLIDYDFSGEYENGIINIPGYDNNAPIAYIDKDGSPIVVNGADKDSVNHVSNVFTDTEHNKGRDDGIDRRGGLYYLSNNGDDSYIPIRLYVEHFNDDSKDISNDTFDKIRDIAGRIADIVIGSNNTNVEAQNKKLHSELGELVKYLDIHKDFFEIGDYPNVGVALRYSTPENPEGKLRRPDQMSQEWMIDFLAGLDRSVQIRKDDNGSIINLSDYVSQGLITSNARMLRPKGVDFYIDAWDDKLKDFAPMTDYQRDVIGDPNVETWNNPDNNYNSSTTHGLNSHDDIDDFLGEFDSQDVIKKEKSLYLPDGISRSNLSDLKKALGYVTNEIDRRLSDNKDSEVVGAEDSSLGLSGLRDTQKDIASEIKRREDRIAVWSGILGDKEGFVGSDKIEALFKALNKNPEYSPLFEKVMGIAKANDTKFHVGQMSVAKLGQTKYTGEIRFNLGLLSSSANTDQRVAETILHELIHNATISTMMTLGVNPDMLTKEQRDSAREIYKIYDLLLDYKRAHKVDERVAMLLSTPFEMVAGIASPKFREFLKNIDGQNFWQRLWSAIKRIFGFDNLTGNTMLERLNKAADNLINNFDNGIYDSIRAVMIDEMRKGSLSGTDVYTILSKNTDRLMDVAASPLKAFSELPKSFRDRISYKGYSESEYNRMPELLKDKVLRCL